MSPSLAYFVIDGLRARSTRSHRGNLRLYSSWEYRALDGYRGRYCTSPLAADPRTAIARRSRHSPHAAHRRFAKWDHHIALRRYTRRIRLPPRTPCTNLVGRNLMAAVDSSRRKPAGIDVLQKSRQLRFLRCCTRCNSHDRCTWQERRRGSPCRRCMGSRSEKRHLLGRPSAFRDDPERSILRHHRWDHNFGPTQRTRARLSPSLNPGSAGLQLALSHLSTPEQKSWRWLQQTPSECALSFPLESLKDYSC